MATIPVRFPFIIIRYLFIQQQSLYTKFIRLFTIINFILGPFCYQGINVESAIIISDIPVLTQSILAAFALLTTPHVVAAYYWDSMQARSSKTAARIDTCNSATIPVCSASSPKHYFL